MRGRASSREVIARYARSGMTQQNANEFEGRIARAAEDRYRDHLPPSVSSIDTPRTAFEFNDQAEQNFRLDKMNDLATVD